MDEFLTYATKILIVNIYGEVIDPLPIKKPRKPYRHHNSGCLTRTTKSSHIKVQHPFCDTGCLCGREKSCSLCRYCSYKKVEKIDMLCKKAVDLLENADTAATTANDLHKERKAIFKNCWMKGIKF